MKLLRSQTEPPSILQEGCATSQCFRMQQDAGKGEGAEGEASFVTLRLCTATNLFSSFASSVPAPSSTSSSSSSSLAADRLGPHDRLLSGHTCFIVRLRAAGVAVALTGA